MWGLICGDTIRRFIHDTSGKSDGKWWISMVNRHFCPDIHHHPWVKTETNAKIWPVKMWKIQNISIYDMASVGLWNVFILGPLFSHCSRKDCITESLFRTYRAGLVIHVSWLISDTFWGVILAASWCLVLPLVCTFVPFVLAGRPSCVWVPQAVLCECFANVEERLDITCQAPGHRSQLVVL